MLRLVSVAAVVEALTLVGLLANLATAHLPSVAGVLGPVHGCAYLMIIVGTLMLPGAPTSARWWAVVPGVGGLMALRRLHVAGAPS